MRRSFLVTVLLGMLIAVVSAGAAAGADEPCAGTLPDRLRCWARSLDDGPVTVTLNRQLQFDGSKQDRTAAIDGAKNHRGNLVVQVSAGASTGQGGTALLVLAGRRLVDPDARIDRLDPQTLTELKGVCDALCDLLDATKHKGAMTGRDLIGKNDGVIDLTRYTYAVGGPPSESSWSDTTRILLLALTGLLTVLLLVLLFAVRRSRAPAAPGVGAVSAAATSAGADETTALLRTAPARSYGRRVGPRSGPARTAVVRTALHPQGYVELDRVLYRAVWAEPGQRPPAPGSVVDVTDGRLPDTDVLYAFPPAAGRHARSNS
ncbi:hypothetical protein ABT186_06705 [Streptomyces sp. NPDC001634]|uniref:hypothetical protein n=1 Tax=Streptomyces sp. NPDC001634 TaxID=3154390 RepID=UPI00332D084E